MQYIQYNTMYTNFYMYRTVMTTHTTSCQPLLVNM